MPVTTDDGTLLALARDLVAALRARGWRLATAESCTGGGVAHAITSIAGSSDVFDRGFVTYSNEAKAEMLGVPADTIERDGAVSEAVAIAMADGALCGSRADVAVAITGVAGPGGGTEAKPVGMVCFAWARSGGTTEVRTHRLPGDRAAVRAASVRIAMVGLLAMARSGGIGGN
ncbi:nicotinamide-nucleotide amidase [Burkholderiales bacterium]|nr:nicotinamide-nucleotide amidase [Burkholderiales bacterium]